MFEWLTEILVWVFFTGTKTSEGKPQFRSLSLHQFFLLYWVIHNIWDTSGLHFSHLKIKQHKLLFWPDIHFHSHSHPISLLAFEIKCLERILSALLFLIFLSLFSLKHIPAAFHAHSSIHPTLTIVQISASSNPVIWALSTSHFTSQQCFHLLLTPHSSFLYTSAPRLSFSAPGASHSSHPLISSSPCNLIWQWQHLHSGFSPNLKTYTHIYNIQVLEIKRERNIWLYYLI